MALDRVLWRWSLVWISLLPEIGGNGNPYCWSGSFTYELCCDPMKGPQGEAECWDETFTYAFCCNETVTNHGTESAESMEPTEPKTGVGKYVRFHQNHGFHLESAVITERQESLKKGISSCQARWGWDLNIQWGPPIGVYAEFSGVPLRHLGHGWDGQQHGDFPGCIAFNGRFFLVQLGFETQSWEGEVSTHRLHFGFCAPSICSVKEVVDELAPRYALQVANARRLMMRIRSVDAWEWPHFLDAVYADADATLAERMQEVSLQIKVCCIAIISFLSLGTMADHFCFDQVPRPAQKSCFAHWAQSFSLKRSWAELWQPKAAGLGVDLLRTLATLFLLCLHLELSQIAQRTEKLVPSNLRISFYFRAVLVMTVLTLHFALESGSTGLKEKSFWEISQKCNLKLARKFLRQWPLIILSVWWDRVGSRFAFQSKPLSYLDGTQSQVEGSVLQWNTQQDIYGCRRSFWTCALRFHTINWQVRDATERILACFGFLLLQAMGLNYAGVLELLLCVFGLAYFYIDYFHEQMRWDFTEQHYMLAKRLENPAFLGDVEIVPLLPPTSFSRGSPPRSLSLQFGSQPWSMDEPQNSKGRSGQNGRTVPSTDGEVHVPLEILTKSG
ncbi:unnamed protein product [Durusdinium trenchii]|uniref:Nose resistant-to-fluoxetine protein N-terminal domain-containing protein n=1 Tax=Durusdinium trenchii TaxID=1381693 RepID=A0ABP0SCG0_9DINO